MLSSLNKFESNKIKLLYNNKRLIYLYLVLVKFKNIKPFLKKDKLSRPINLKKLNLKYENYIFILNGQSDIVNKDINVSNIKKDSLKRNNYLNIIENNSSIMKLFLKKYDKKNRYYKSINSVSLNIIEEGFRNIKLKEMSNKLLTPYYFFTSRYNEKILSSQVKSWYSSVYNFLKFEKSEIKYLDLYTNRLIKLFFSLKYIQRKKIWDNILFNSLKIKANKSIIQHINVAIKYTSKRSSLAQKYLNYYSSSLSTFNWLLEQVRFSSYVRKVILNRKEGIIAGLKMKKKSFIRKWDKIFISKPFFKHTSFNVIIDLFIYNNKTNKLQKFENMLYRRILYKYMYSMYIDYTKKIKETLSRPRFFYLNIIEPKIFNYYSNIIKLYENILISSNKSGIYFLFFILFKWNFFFLNYTKFIKSKYLLFNFFNNEIKGKNKYDLNKSKYNNIIKKEKEKFVIILDDLNNGIVYKKQFFIKNKNAYKDINNKYYNYLLLLKKRNMSYNNFYNINKIKNKLKRKKSIFELNKEYHKELEWKSNNYIDLSKLTLWNRKGLGKVKVKDKSKKREKHFGHNKYSLEQYKKKIYYAKGKIKRKVAPEVWKQKLMSFFLFSKSQKKDVIPHKKYIHVNNKIISNDLNKIKINKKYNNINNSKDIVMKNNLENYKYKDNNIKSFNEEKKIKLSNNKSKKLILSDKSIFLSDKINFNSVFYNELDINKNINLNNNNDNFRYLKNDISNISLNNFLFLNINKNVTTFLDKKNVIININKTSKDKKYKYKNDIEFKKKKIKKNNIFNYIYDIKINKIYNNSKIIWNNLDFSIINLLNKIFELKINKSKIKLSNFNYFFNKIKKFLYNNNIWYLYLIKKEFYIINRDVILSKTTDVLPKYNINLKNNYEYDNNIYSNIILNYENIKGRLNINIWSSNIKNKRNDNLKYNKLFNGEIFKPYYRYMIPIYIYQSFKSFILYLRSKNSFINFWNLITSKINWININNNIILNFIIVKTLLHLIHYNYRSLIKIKSKYYYLNKLRYYGIKMKRLNFNTWITSVKYIKKLRRTPRYFWLRYHKLASFYYNRIIQNAELDTKRKILLPFVFYFEDFLFNIYGKWGIIRLWPIKRFYLNSFILAERIMLVILTQNSSSSSISEYRQSVRNLINIMKWFQIKKSYDLYNENIFRWSENLINMVKSDNCRYHHLNYSGLEFFNWKLEKNCLLNAYPLRNDKLNYYLPSVNIYYIHEFKESLNRIKNQFIKRKLLYKYGKINSNHYVYYWLRPLHSYLMNIRNYLDINGIKFKLTGRPGVVRSNVRSFTKTYLYGNLLGAKHFNFKTLNTASLSSPLIRGTIKSNIDYDYFTSKSNNGSITLKVWISSMFANDIHELLLYLLRIKYLFNQLLNRYYLVYNKFYNLKHYYFFDKTSKLIQLKKKINIKNNLNIIKKQKKKKK